MRKASVSDLKARLSEFLRVVKSGEEVIVTERGAPIARLAPLGGPRRLEARVQALLDAGLARSPLTRLPRDFWDTPSPRDPEGLSLRALLEEREQAR